MAIYGAPSAGVALTATTGNDTIGMFGPITATPSLSAATVISDAGADLINLGVQGVTSTAVAAFSGTHSGSGEEWVISARVVGQDAVYTSQTRLSGISGGTAFTVSVTGVTTSYQALRKLVGSQIYANAGNDTVALGFELDTASASTIGGGAGADLIGTYRAINDVFSTGSITGGGAFDNMFVEGGGDGDTIYLNGNAYALNGSTIQGGQGNDTIAVILSGNSQLSATQILGGGGNDVFSGNGQHLNLMTAVSNTIAGGGGADSINITFQATATSNYILGDALNTLGEYDGDDLITLVTRTDVSSNTVQAGGGNDTLRLSGAQGGSNLFQMQAGDDLVSADFGVLTSVTVQMGAGADSVYIYSGGLSGGSLVNLGGGDDLFSYSAMNSGANSDAASVATVFGGLGADTFTAGHYNSGTVGITIGYSSVSDSTITAFDTIAIGNAAASGSYTLQYEPGGATLATTAGTNSFTATNGVAIFTGTYDGSVTARYNELDSTITTEGASTIFFDSGNVTYFFVKGSDTNLITQVASASRGTGTISIAGGKTFTINNA